MSGTGGPGSRGAAGRRRWAWAVPVGTAVVVAGAAVAFNVDVAGAASLPAVGPSELVQRVLESSTRAFSGTVVTTADLGVPALPGVADSASLSPLAFLTGRHTSQVWVDGPDRQRVAVTAQLSEADVVHSGDDVWTYSSEANAYSHQTLPTGAGDGHAAPEVPADLPRTPQAAAQQLLAALDPTTTVTVSDDQRVAGRDAYTLVLRPRTPDTTVREVTIAVDGATSVPLAVAVRGAAASPALSIAMTQVDFATPPASRFAFTPPAGATRTDDPFGAAGLPHADHAAPSAATGLGRPTVTGTGWAAVVSVPGAGAGLDASKGVLSQLTTSLPGGARLLHTALINAVVTADGRLVAGAVPVEAVERAAGVTP